MNDARRKFLAYLAASPLTLMAGDFIPAKASDAVNVFDLEAAARKNLPPAHFGYLTTGVEADATLRANRDAFSRYHLRPRRLVVMVQLEVAEAIVAKPGRMSLLSVATQVYGDTSMVMKVAPGAFSPPPKVESAVVRIDVAPTPKVDVALDAFFRIARAGFGNPRKQLRNSLSFGLHVKQEVIDQLMARAGVDATLRPQALSLDEWAAIARAWDGFSAEPQRHRGPSGGGARV